MTVIAVRLKPDDKGSKLFLVMTKSSNLSWLAQLSIVVALKFKTSLYHHIYLVNLLLLTNDTRLITPYRINVFSI